MRIKLLNYIYPLLIKRTRLCIWIAVTIITCLSTSFIFFHSSRTAEAAVEHQYEKYYQSVWIESGDTLWEIAKKYYSPEWRSMDQYIKEIQRLNHLENENIISGGYLLIPYYALP